MSAIQDVREYIVSATKCPYTPPFGSMLPWMENPMKEREAPFRSSMSGLDVGEDDEASFKVWHRYISAKLTQTQSNMEFSEYLELLPELRKKYLTLTASEDGKAMLCTADGLLMISDKLSTAEYFPDFMDIEAGARLEIGGRTLKVETTEVPAGAITVVMTAVKEQLSSLAFVKINASDLAADDVFEELRHFIKYGLVRRPLHKLLAGNRKNMVISFSIWKGNIRFHNFDETRDAILPDFDHATFAQHMRLNTLLVASVQEQSISAQIDEIIESFTTDYIDVAPQERMLLGRLLKKISKKPNLLGVKELRSVLGDCALLNGYDTMRIPEDYVDKHVKPLKPKTTVTLPIDEAKILLESHTCDRPFWYGRFWADQDVEFREYIEPIGSAAACIKRLSNLPYDEVIEKTLELEPRAAGLLRRWREIWDRSFPGWQSMPQWHFDKSEKETTEHFVHDVSRAFNWVTVPSVSKAEGITILDNWVVDVDDDKRDYRLHVIDCADAVCSMIHLSPGAGFFDALGVIIQYTGQDNDGYPIFRAATEAQKRVHRRLDNHPEYWNWPFYKKYLGRRGVVTRDGKHTAAVLADMALQGHTHAFLKGVAQKSGTWTVNLERVVNLETAFQSLAATLERDQVNASMYVQEHVPFTHEQRFYIQGGRMFASACSDRHFSVMDSNGKRLDSRVAVLETPAIDTGAFDRGVTHHVEDRKTSAMFARQVRKIAAELREYGLQDYSVDMGLTERGMISVEVNTLHMAGPYNMRRELFTKQFERSRKRANDLLAKRVIEIIKASQLPEHIQQKAISLTSAADNLVQLALSFSDANEGNSYSEETRIAMIVLMISILDKNGSDNKIMTEAA